MNLLRSNRQWKLRIGKHPDPLVSLQSIVNLNCENCGSGSEIYIFLEANSDGESEVAQVIKGCLPSLRAWGVN